MNCPESYIKNLYKTLWSTSDAPVEGVTPFAQQPEHTIWTFQAELREIQDALSPRGPESLAALEHALSIGRAWWEQCGLTLFRQGVRVSRLPLSYLRETVGVSSYEDCGLLSLSFLSNERQLDYIPPFADLLHEEALPCRRIHADLLEAQEDLCELPDAHWDEDDVSEFYCAQLGMCQACSEEMYAYGLQYGRKKEP